MIMKRVLKFAKSHFTIFLIVTFLAIQKSYKETPIKKISRFLPDMKHILILSKIHGLEGEGQGYFIDHKCKHTNCYFSKNRNLFGDVRYFDVVLFNLQEVSDDSVVIPSLRSSSQKYVFVANDSSDNYPVCNPMYDYFFNWTWTYRFDSTISYRFITIYNSDYQELGSHFQWIYTMQPIDHALKTQFVTKSKAAVVFLDKCHTTSAREILITKLNANLEKYNQSVDIFGKCGERQCKRKTMNPCFWRLRKSYYFYLAFEDSFSFDYVTDIVLYGYKNNAVPIVYGGARYDIWNQNEVLQVMLVESTTPEDASVSERNVTFPWEVCSSGLHYTSVVIVSLIGFVYLGCGLCTFQETPDGSSYLMLIIAKYLPPGSYLSAVNVSMENLAFTINDIITHKQKYYDFFKWRNHYTIAKAPGLNACDLCEMLNNPARLTHSVVYGKFRWWWNHLFKKRCQNY